ncbi:MAG: hypothetical protein JW852_08400 [Spirochaetales bacterium]|nr:hypothetical protein [Spirochaetales bacterium]
MKIEKALWAIGIMMMAAALPVVAVPTDVGQTASFEFGMGTQGIMSYEELGIRIPVASNGLSVALSARLLSSLTWATFINLETGGSVSFHPDVVAGVVSFGGSSPLVHGALRAHGAVGLLLGYSFTPWDSAIYGVPNLIGPNFTFALTGTFGLELFTAPRVSVCIDAGGGWKSIVGDEANPYVIASSWLGSGFGIRMGMRFYL